VKVCTSPHQWTTVDWHIKLLSIDFKKSINLFILAYLFRRKWLQWCTCLWLPCPALSKIFKCLGWGNLYQGRWKNVCVVDLRWGRLTVSKLQSTRSLSQRCVAVILCNRKTSFFCFLAKNKVLVEDSLNVFLSRSRKATVLCARCARAPSCWNKKSSLDNLCMSGSDLFKHENCHDSMLSSLWHKIWAIWLY